MFNPFEKYSDQMLDKIREVLLDEVLQGEGDDATLLTLSGTLTEQAMRVVESEQEQTEKSVL